MANETQTYPKHPTASTVEEALDMVQDGWRIVSSLGERVVVGNLTYLQTTGGTLDYRGSMADYVSRAIQPTKILDNLGNTVWDKVHEPELVQVDKVELERLRSIANSLGK